MNKPHPAFPVLWELLAARTERKESRRRRCRGAAGLWAWQSGHRAPSPSGRVQVLPNEMMTQLHILEFSMNVLLVSHFLSYTSAAAFACKI